MAGRAYPGVSLNTIEDRQVRAALRVINTYLKDLSKGQAASASAAPSEGLPAESYIVVNLSASLTNERKLDVTAPISKSDGGAGASMTISLDIPSLTADGSPDGAADYVVTYDAGAGGYKKVLLDDLPGGFTPNANPGVDHSSYVAGGPGTDTTAIHDDTVDEIHTVTLKGSPDSADVVLIEDSLASWAKKRVTVGSLGGGGGGDYIRIKTVDVTDGANFNDTTPTPPSGSANVKWQRSGTSPDSVSAYLDMLGDYVFTPAAALIKMESTGGVQLQLSSDSASGNSGRLTFLRSAGAFSIDVRLEGNPSHVLGINQAGGSNLFEFDCGAGAGLRHFTVKSGALKAEGGTAQSVIQRGLQVNASGGAGATYDFQVQTDTEPNMIDVDSTNDFLKLGGGTNYVKVAKGGIMTFEGTADIDLPDGSVDLADLNFMTTKGDLLVGGPGGSHDPAILGVGTNGKVLTANSLATNGVTWSSPAGGTTKSGVASIADSSWSSVGFTSAFASVPEVVVTIDEASPTNLERLYIRSVTVNSFEVYQAMKTGATVDVHWIATDAGNP